MFDACVAVTVVAALLLALSARLKFIRDPDAVAKLSIVGVSTRYLTPLGTLEVLGAAGALTGLAAAPIGITAAAALVGYFVVAMTVHVFRDGLKGIGPAVLVFVFVTAALVTRILSA